MLPPGARTGSPRPDAARLAGTRSDAGGGVFVPAPAPGAGAHARPDRRAACEGLLTRIREAEEGGPGGYFGSLLKVLPDHRWPRTVRPVHQARASQPL